MNPILMTIPVKIDIIATDIDDNVRQWRDGGRIKHPLFLQHTKGCNVTEIIYNIVSQYRYLHYRRIDHDRRNTIQSYVQRGYLVFIVIVKLLDVAVI